ncbi:hypothetical protein JIG36_13535 [Actinoplanes sp. LDG1-06]|uniref:Uncharacterized protein n=1 Tax=Paractinoplanes ovalisporus TaxID=2810368 RepID=A0ABS2ABB8_9ACTN|nr:hypothetical protein [Actinoplanes ovalisporus]MBM2616581.1 hypothetical protein [Actinoplanes ovalisporus]
MERQIVLRRWTRPVYQVGAVVAFVATVQAVIVPAVGGPAWVWGAVPVLGAAATLMTIKSIPYGHVKYPA